MQPAIAAISNARVRDASTALFPMRFGKTGIVMIVAIIGRLVTPETSRFFPRELRISSYEVPGRRHSRRVRAATDRFSRCTAPTILHYSPQGRARSHRRHAIFHRVRPAGSAKCFTFTGKQYCESWEFVGWRTLPETGDQPLALLWKFQAPAF